MDKKSFYIIVLLVYYVSSSTRYSPTWESLDERPNPKWYDDAKIGIFIHWGVFSVPSFGSEWFWYNWKGRHEKIYEDFMKSNYKPDFTYADFAPKFTAEFFKADQWADIFQSSGAKYVVLTSKHHEGYTLWPSKYSFNWNAQSVGPGKDLVGEFAKAIRNKTDIHFGLYHSLYEWFNPLYLADKANKFKTNDFVKQKTLPELYELVHNYQPDVIWSDGDWEASDTYWNSTEFISWLYNDSPVKDTVVTNDRWGSGVLCHHGGFYTCMDRYNPKKLQNHKWENAMTIDSKSWGFRREMSLNSVKSLHELITILTETVSCGGNLLMNIGPTHDGRIVPIFEERLRGMGAWLKTNGEAIYKSKPWTHQNDTITKGIWYTMPKYSVSKCAYAIVLEWPSNGVLTLGAPIPDQDTTVIMLGLRKPLRWTYDPSLGLNITFPMVPLSQLPSFDAWVIKIANVKN